jgi:hypothetical protein
VARSVNGNGTLESTTPGATLDAEPSGPLLDVVDL